MALIKKNSGVHGIGIFTDELIVKGDVVYQIPLENVIDYNSFRFVSIGQGKYVNDERILNWVNHCCQPTTKLIIRKDQPILVALRNIMKDEEITFDYNQTQKVNFQFTCSCGQANCQEKIGKK